MKSAIQKVVNLLGYQLVKVPFVAGPLPHDMDEEFKQIYEKSLQYTITSMARMFALYKAVQYIVKNRIPGDLVECGVWKGGSSMVTALSLSSCGANDRTLWLYDTYEGPTQPTDKDVRANDGLPALQTWKNQKQRDDNSWMYSPLDEVKANMSSTNYPSEKIMYVKGKVEETIPDTIPAEIALLRLDTDFYESTNHELQHLFPRLSPNGVLIIDDYGWWRGSRDATDQYFAANDVDILLHRVDSVSRVAVKPQMG